MSSQVSCKFNNTLIWQLDSFLVNFLLAHLSLLICFWEKHMTHGSLSTTPKSLVFRGEVSNWSAPAYNCNPPASGHWLWICSDSTQLNKNMLEPHAYQWTLNPRPGEEDQSVCLPGVLSLSRSWFFGIFFYSLIVVNSLEIVHNSFVLFRGFHLLTRPSMIQNWYYKCPRRTIFKDKIWDWFDPALRMEPNR